MTKQENTSPDKNAKDAAAAKKAGDGKEEEKKGDGGVPLTE
jgi:hypothetical protein